MFSVIIPIYNKEKQVARAIQSVLHQTFIDFELILINDASTDNSLQVASSFADPRIKILQRSQPGAGGYAARNDGIRRASRKYVAFLDADDQWNPAFLFNIHKLILQFPDAGVFATAWEETNGLKSKTNAYFNKYNQLETHLTESFYAVSSQGFNPLCTIVAVTTKQLMLQAGAFPDGKCKRGGDIETWMRLMIGQKLAWSPYIGAIYYKNIKKSVTKTISDVETPYVYFSVLELSNSLPKNLQKDLKKYANYYTKMSIVRGIVAGKNKQLLLKHFFREEDQLFYFFAKSLSLIPFFLLKPLFNLYRKLMLTFSKSDLG